VYLSCSINGQPAANSPIRKNVSRYRDTVFRDVLVSRALFAPLRVSLRLEAFRKASFGERFEFLLKPQ